MGIGVQQSMAAGAEKLVVARASTEVGGVIPAKPRRGFALGTMHTQTKFSTLIFPIFDGENPIGSVYKCDRFFKYNEVPEPEKVGITSIHLDGKALDWFQGYEAPNKVLNWKMFVMDITTRFGQETYDNLIGQITKLRQTSFVHTYREQFGALMVRTRGLMDGFYVQCFVSSLMDAIKNQVMMSKPTTLSQAIGLALLQENIIKAVMKEAMLSSETLTCKTREISISEIRAKS